MAGHVWPLGHTLGSPTLNNQVIYILHIYKSSIHEAATTFIGSFVSGNLANVEKSEIHSPFYSVLVSTDSGGGYNIRLFSYILLHYVQLVAKCLSNIPGWAGGVHWVNQNLFIENSCLLQLVVTVSQKKIKQRTINQRRAPYAKTIHWKMLKKKLIMCFINFTTTSNVFQIVKAIRSVTLYWIHKNMVQP